MGAPVPLVKQLPAAVVPAAAAAAVYSQDPEYEDYNAEEQYKVSHIFPARSITFPTSSCHVFFFKIRILNFYILLTVIEILTKLILWVNFVFQVHHCKKRLSIFPLTFFYSVLCLSGVAFYP